MPPKFGVLGLVQDGVAPLALGQAEDLPPQGDFLMGQAIEAADHLRAGPQPQHAIDRGDFLLHVLCLVEQALQHFAVDRDRAPRDAGVGQHADQRGVLERIQLGLAEAHGLAAAQLAVAKVIQRLGNHGLVERMRCGHAASLAHVPGAVVPASRSSRRRARRSSRNSLTNAVSLKRLVQSPWC